MWERSHDSGLFLDDPIYLDLIREGDLFLDDDSSSGISNEILEKFIKKSDK